MNSLTVAPHERGVIRLFALDMRPEEAKFLREPGAADQMLGVEGLEPEQIDIFPVSDLEDLGLYGYLHEGCSVSAEQLDRAVLEAIEGWVMAVRSAAFKDQAAQLKPDPRLRLIGLFTEDSTNWSGGKISTESAKPYSAPTPAPRAVRARAQRLGATIFAIVMFLLVGGVLWLIL